MSKVSSNNSFGSDIFNKNNKNNKNRFYLVAMLVNAGILLCVSLSFSVEMQTSEMMLQWHHNRSMAQGSTSSLAALALLADTTTTLPVVPNAPQQAAYANQTAVICSIVKGEEAYIDEWVDYHLGLGFAHIYVYDNSYHFDLQQWAAEQTAAGRPVTVRHWKGTAQQLAVNHHCVQELQEHNKARWVAIFDVDEFLGLHQDYTHVNDFLGDHCQDGALSLNWALMGAGGREVYEPNPVSQRFTQRWTSDHGFGERFHHIKTISNVQHVDLNGRLHEHFLPLKKPHVRKDAAGRTLKSRDTHNFAPDALDVAAFYHYRSKSSKEYSDKYLKGRASRIANDKKKVEYYIKRGALGLNVERGDLVDNTIWKALVRNNPAYRVFEEPLATTTTAVTPSASQSTSKAAICGVIQDDEPYLDEWIDYHRGLGFTHFYLFDQSEGMRMEKWALKKGANIDLYAFPMLPEKMDDDKATAAKGKDNDEESTKRKLKDEEKAQRKPKDPEAVLSACIHTAKENGDEWLALLDVEDFLVLKKHQNVEDMLDDFDDFDGLGVYKYMFGTSDRRLYQPKPVLKRFQYREAELDASFSSFLHVKDTIDPSRLGRYTDLAKEFKTIVDTSRAGLARTPPSINRPSDVAVVHSYQTKSMAEYLIRERGTRALSVESAATDKFILDIFGGSLPAGSVLDDTAWSSMKAMHPNYAVYDHLMIP
jgi:hypothetical protein